MNYFQIAILLVLSACTLVSCKNKSEQESIDTLEMTQKSDNLVDDPENEGQKMLLGLVSQNDFKNDSLFPWMTEHYNQYEPNKTIVLDLKEKLEGVTIKTFMGTWCEDSQREIPHLYKILNASNYNDVNMQIVAVSHDKDTPNGYEKDLEIAYVPTIIFYKENTEIGRFVEYAQGASLEEDIRTILKGAPYTPAYAE